jgi:hypothetical protein
LRKSLDELVNEQVNLLLERDTLCTLPMRNVAAFRVWRAAKIELGMVARIARDLQAEEATRIRFGRSATLYRVYKR